MKRLNFVDEALIPIILGKKRITIRKYREGSHDVTFAQILRAEFPCGLGLLIRVTNTPDKTPLKMLSQDTLERDGYANHEEALADLKNFYPYLTMESDVIAISFEPLGYSISFEDQPLIDARDVAFPAW